MVSCKKLNMFNNHPINHIISLYDTKVIPENSTLHFSNYNYSYTRNIDMRTNFSMEIQNVNEVWLQNHLLGLTDGWNLSFHGNIIFPNGKEYFLPLIDFNTSIIDEKIIEICEFRLSKSKELAKHRHIFEVMKLYSSGRSYHGYGSILLEYEDWKKYSVALLLFNYTRLHNELDTIVDTRWIAHRILSGYPCLRWSNNSNHYLQYPQLFKEHFL